MVLILLALKGVLCAPLTSGLAPLEHKVHEQAKHVLRAKQPKVVLAL